MKRASTWTVLLALGAATTSCRSLLDTDVRFEDEDPSTGSTQATSGSSTGTSTTTGGGSTGSSQATTTSSSSEGIGGSGASSSSSAGGASSSSSSGGGGAASCPRDDDFPGSELSSCWTVTPGDGTVHEVSGDSLIVTPVQETGWYGPDRGILIFQEASGDFAASVHVHVAATQGDYQMGGFVVRDPNARFENWIKWELGMIEDGDGVGGGGAGQVWTTLGVVTRDDASSFPPLDPAIPLSRAHEADLGICRLEGTFALAVRFEGDWLEGPAVGPEVEYTPDLGRAVQVGLNVASEGPQTTNVSTFTRFRIDDSPTGSDCVTALEQLLP